MRETKFIGGSKSAAFFLPQLTVTGVICRKAVKDACRARLGRFYFWGECKRRYEKQRDRFLTKQGYKILHFTGTKIWNDPMSVAAEVISFLTGDSTENLLSVLDEFTEK